MDATVAIIVGLISGSVGAITTALLTISHEREKQLRERMITAADDFGTGVFQAIMALRDAQAAALKHGRRDRSGQVWITNERGDRIDEIETAYQEASRRVDETTARYPRIQLLFGVDTPAENAARSCVLDMEVALANLRAYPFPNFPAYNKAFLGLFQWHEKFAARAREAIRGERSLGRIMAFVKRPKRTGERERRDESEAAESSLGPKKHDVRTGV